MKIKEVKEGASPEFTINSSYKAFSDRQKNVFDQLNVAEETVKHLLPVQERLMEVDDIDVEQSSKRSGTKQFSGRESIFKRPNAPIGKCMPTRKMPDFKKNPHKWTKYSLDDVPNEDMSDRANTSAAMLFLKEIEQRKQNNETTFLPRKVTFKKHIVKDGDSESHNEVPVFRNTKVVMPEYVVGQKIKKSKKTSVKPSAAVTEIKLDHLLEDEDGDD